MAHVDEKWDEFGKAVDGLALRLKLHLEQAGGEVSQSTQDAESAVAQAGDKLRVAVEEGFEALGVAWRDEAVRADVTLVGQTLADALAATFDKVSEDLKESLAAKH